MGYHYFNIDLIDDISVDPLEPEGLVSAPGPNGQLKLVAVEWIVPKAAWEAAGNTGLSGRRATRSTGVANKQSTTRQETVKNESDEE